MSSPTETTNQQFHLARTAFHQQAIREQLSALSFNDHAKIKLQPENEEAVPLVFVTGVNAEKFDPEKHIMTPTKATVNVGNHQYMLNQSAAFVDVLLRESRHEIVMQVKPDSVERVREIFSRLPGYERIHIIPVATDDKTLTGKFYQAASGISDEKPIARVDLALYESFAAGMSQPFKPIYAEDPAVVGNAVTKRAAFYHQMCLIAYDLLANTDQESLRVLSLTALAARRVGGNLLADAAHKQISTNYVETLAHEASFHFPEKNIYCVEVAPGIVDNGIYDSPLAREATVERAMINGYAFIDSISHSDSIRGMPKLSPTDIGTIAAQYLVHAAGEEFHDRLAPHVQELANAGRNADTLKTAGQSMVRQDGDHIVVTNALPTWAYTSGTTVGRFAPLQKGYRFVPVCPTAQLF